jgi:hypothetical protein
MVEKKKLKKIKLKDTHKWLRVVDAKKLVSKLNKDKKITGYSKMKKAEVIKAVATKKYSYVKSKQGKPELRPTGTGMRRQKVYKL